MTPYSTSVVFLVLSTDAFLLSKPALVKNSSDIEDIYEDIQHLHDFNTPRIITSPISLPTSPTSPLIEFRTSPYYYSELLSNTPGNNINIKTSTLAPYKKTSQYRSRNSQTLNGNNFRTYVPKVASEQLNELHKRFAEREILGGSQLSACKDLYSVVDKKNKEKFQHSSDANGNPLSTILPSENTSSDLVQGSIDYDVPPAKPPLIRNGNFVKFSNELSVSKNYSYQENSDEEKPLTDTSGETSEGQITPSITSPSDSIQLFEKPVYQNINYNPVSRPSSLNFKRNIEFETFQANKTSNVTVCRNKPPLQPKKSHLNRSTFGKVRPRSFECERVTIAVQSSFIKNRPKSLETPKFEIDDEFFKSQLERSRNDLKENQIYFLPSPYTENDFSGRIEQIKEEEEEDMFKSRQFYETAFDSKVSKSDDDLDIDEVTHRSLLNLKRPNSACGFTSSNLTFRKKLVKSKSANLQKFTSLKPKYLASVESLTESLNDLGLNQSPSPDNTFQNITNTPPLSCSKNLTPPSTEPLPPKFSNMNLLTPKSLKCEKPKKQKNSFIRSTMSKVRGVRKYLSSDSMTSSSNSLDSLNSSSSNNSRSNSISSHSSDGGGASNYNVPSHHLVRHAKLNILSPISDKSSMDPSSEYESNKVNTVAIIEEKKPSPDPVSSKSRRRILQNKNFPNRIDNHQGSDSGISMESKTDLFKDFNSSLDKSGKNRNKEYSRHRDSVNSIDIQDLPFDMPKLKKREGTPIVNQPKPFVCFNPGTSRVDEIKSSGNDEASEEGESSCLYVKESHIQKNSQTETKVDTNRISTLELNSLPFDMPKLQRKMQQEAASRQMDLHSIRPAEEVKTRSSQTSFEGDTVLNENETIELFSPGDVEKEIEEEVEEKLPFDMPKLRWRRQASQQHAMLDLYGAMSDEAGACSTSKGKFSFTLNK